MEREVLKKIKKITEEFLKKACIEAEVFVSAAEDSTVPIKLKSEDPETLIGQGGEVLAEIQHILKAILRRKIDAEENFFINLDVNDYKKKKAEYLREMAISAADEASLLKKEKILPPMSAYERRIVHMELAGRSDVFSESVGEGQDRKVIVKPGQKVKETNG